MNKLIYPVIGGAAILGGYLIVKAVTKKPSSYTLELTHGVNYVSFPMIPENPDTLAIFEAGVTVLAYIPPGGWYYPPSVEPGFGYYVYYPPTEPKTITITGTESIVKLSDLINTYNSLPEGAWILIGVGTDKINIKGTILEGKVTAYNKATETYETTNTLIPTVGYWMGK